MELSDDLTRPTIALNCDVFPVVESTAPPERQRAGVWLEYIDVLADLGASPVVIPPRGRLTSTLGIDGVLLIGSDDYRLGNANGTPQNFVAVDRRREESDIALTRAALDLDVPMLAICGGFQLVTLVAGGTIYGDLASECPSDVQHSRDAQSEQLPTHVVEWGGHPSVPSTAPGRYTVNTHHHQAVQTLPREWTACAVAGDGVIESGFGPGRFQCGVQWHPERDSGELSQAILAAFLEAARQHRQRRSTLQCDAERSGSE